MNVKGDRWSDWCGLHSHILCVEMIFFQSLCSLHGMSYHLLSILTDCIFLILAAVPSTVCSSLDTLSMFPLLSPKNILLNITFRCQQFIVTGAIYHPILGNGVKTVPVCPYIMPILHLKSPWRFLRVRYITILLGILVTFPFPLHWFVVQTSTSSNHPSDWQRGWFRRLTLAFVEARYALSSNELVINQNRDHFAVWDSSSWGCCWPHTQTTFFLRLSPFFLFQPSSRKENWDSVIWISLFCDAMAPIKPLGNLCLITQPVFCNTFATFKEFSFLVLELSFSLLGLWHTSLLPNRPPGLKSHWMDRLLKGDMAGLREKDTAPAISIHALSWNLYLDFIRPN